MRIFREQRDAEEKSRMTVEKQVEKLSRELEKVKNENLENKVKIKFLEQMLKEKKEEVKEKNRENQRNMDNFRWVTISSYFTFFSGE